MSEKQRLTDEIDFLNGQKNRLEDEKSQLKYDLDFVDGRLGSIFDEITRREEKLAELMEHGDAEDHRRRLGKIFLLVYNIITASCISMMWYLLIYHENIAANFLGPIALISLAIVNYSRR